MNQFNNDLLATILSFCKIETVIRLASCSREMKRRVTNLLGRLSPSYVFDGSTEWIGPFRFLGMFRSCHLTLSSHHRYSVLSQCILRDLPTNVESLTLQGYHFYRSVQPVWPALSRPRLTVLDSAIEIRSVEQSPLKSLTVRRFLPDALPATLVDLAAHELNRRDHARLVRMLPNLPLLSSLTVTKHSCGVFFSFLKHYFTFF